VPVLILILIYGKIDALFCAMRHQKEHSLVLSQSGFIRLKYLPLLLMICSFWAGGQKLYTAITNRTPTVVSYDTFARTKPSADWLVITNCQLNLTRACYLSYAGNADPYEYYVPVESGSSATAKIHILLKTADPGLKATIAEMNKLHSDASARAWMQKNYQRAFPRLDIRGLVRYGIDLKSSERDQLADADKNIAQDFIILDSDAQPSFAAGIAYTITGFALLVALLLYSNRKSDPVLSSS
jgi:hypothetical protein